MHVLHDPGPVHLVIEGNAIRTGWWDVIIASDADGVTTRRNRFSGNHQNVESADAARKRGRRTLTHVGARFSPR